MAETLSDLKRELDESKDIRQAKDYLKMFDFALDKIEQCGKPVNRKEATDVRA